LERIAKLVTAHDAVCFTNEIYNHIVYDDAEHVPMATLPGMRERMVTINALSKTFAVTGWRVGWAVAPPGITDAIRKVHDFVTVGAPHPLQAAGAEALMMPDEYFLSLAGFYRERRDALAAILRETGIDPVLPQGAYYMMAYISAFGWDDDIEFCCWLAREIGVAAVPGSSFFRDSAEGRRWVRFCFSKRIKTLQAARERLLRIKSGRRPA